MASTTSFASILDKHFQANEDYTYDLLQDLLSAEKDLVESLNDIKVSPEDKTPPKHRKKLIEWILNLSDELTVGYKTKHMAVIMVDLCLAKLKIHANFLQLLGITCLFICIKSEESFQYTLQNACDHCANAYTNDQVSAMEFLIFKTLKWKIHNPTPGEIARRLVHITNAIPVEHMPNFFKKVDSFIDLCLHENDLAEYPPSIIAIVCILCAFGGSNLHVFEWSQFLKENDIWSLDFDKAISLYHIIVEEIIKHNPAYFQSVAKVLQEKPSFSLHPKPDIHHYEPSSNDFEEEFPNRDSVYSQNAFFNQNDETLESLSVVQTPVKETKDFRASLLETEKLMKESPQRGGFGGCRMEVEKFN